MKFNYVVQMADGFGFDFGGEGGGLASFRHKGDAWVYAKGVNEALNREVRVVDGSKRGCRVEFLFPVREAVAV